MGYYLYGHHGSGDHSREDRIRGTCALLPEPPRLYSVRPEEDWKYGLGQLAGLFRQTGGALERSLEPGTWCLGCCPGPEPGRLRRRDCKAVLWGWSAEPAALHGKKLRDLGRYDALVVTEGRSLELLRRAGLDKNLRLGPDPAFLVEPAFGELPKSFHPGDTVGLCVSPWSCRFEKGDGLLFRSYGKLIQWILENTRLRIALIPYCVKPRCNDCLLLEALEGQFPRHDRLCRVPDGDSRSLRGALSRCRVVVGSAGAMAAWSCGVPALCLGASVRALGLAEELFGLWQEAVIPVGQLRNETDLTVHFSRFLKTKEDPHRRRLELAVPHRRQQAKNWQWRELLP